MNLNDQLVIVQQRACKHVSVIARRSVVGRNSFDQSLRLLHEVSSITRPVVNKCSQAVEFWVVTATRWTRPKEIVKCHLRDSAKERRTEVEPQQGLNYRRSR